MDALKSAGRAIIRSPSMAKQSWIAGRHKKLPENWTDTRETILEGMTFNLRHLGMTLVDQPKGEDLSAAAVKRIVATAKASGKKPQKVALKVSPQGIVLHDSLTNKLLENVSIYRISYCTVDKLHEKVFAYIAQNTLNGTLECHAYLCSKRKVAQAVALTVAQAFTVAFELWQVAKEEKGKRAKSGSAGEASSSSHSERSNSLGSLKADVATDNLLDFEDNVNKVVETNGNVADDHLVDHRPSETNNNPAWELEDGLDEAFSRSLALTAQDVGTTVSDFCYLANMVLVLFRLDLFRSSFKSKLGQHGYYPSSLSCPLSDHRTRRGAWSRF
ncbi:low density lipoprotein receptor adapter protein 1a isoform X3 [Micropterus salmoides]|uniref:low density lipoprotein receptor adapter protein 1a isoform X3 n=1 Tax=Micropterus salmoides TaxID=27706 RepID=UPI0018ED0CB0|nr:low density lipoprotein receptor adapter protein 1a isoform X3 [Micropterus salmoides]XP_045886422.1 low density lipoprotein receptor adapter protein 1-B-like isoform X3 [Micropterus dolomieu]